MYINNSSENENSTNRRYQQNSFFMDEIVKDSNREGEEKKRKYKIKSKIFREDKNEKKEKKSKQPGSLTLEFEKDKEEFDSIRQAALTKKNMSEINLNSLLSKGPIIEKLVKRSLSKPGSALDGKAIEEAPTKFKSSDKSLISKRSEDVRDKQESPSSKDQMIRLKASDKETQKNIDKSYLEDKTELIQLMNVNFSDIQKDNNSFQIELNNIKPKNFDEGRFDRLIEKSKKELLNKIDYPSTDMQPIIYSKKLNKISGFAASTFQNRKKSNEDKINITLNMSSKKNSLTPIHYFGLFDGHGGSKCAEFLRDNFHKIVLDEENFLKSPDEFILAGFNKAEEIIINTNIEQFNKKKEIDKSGSCANVAFIINDILYIANLGDSRTVLCHQNLTKISQVTTDHKPNVSKEEKRIHNFGGVIYRNTFESPNNSPHQGVPRIKPGGLAVSRTLGDIEAKLINFGGKPNVIVNIPDIIGIKIDNSLDFMLIGSDGIYDKISNKELIQNIIETCIDSIKNDHDIDVFLKNSVQNILKLCVEKDSKDNISCMIIFFENFMNFFRNKNIDILLNKLSKLMCKDYLDNNILEENVVCRREIDEVVLVNNYIQNNSNKIIIQNMNNNIQVNKNLKFFCCGLFCKKKKVVYKQ